MARTTQPLLRYGIASDRKALALLIAATSGNDSRADVFTPGRASASTPANIKIV
jgi:hypothetical protein